ncbi:hypothetical protein HDU84_007521 [Entophlyctis sp. JEL0112]|nr:hypothetical protein HDU84_007521 [Entophlyctis sp. JEL0112]
MLFRSTASASRALLRRSFSTSTTLLSSLSPYVAYLQKIAPSVDQIGPEQVQRLFAAEDFGKLNVHILDVREPYEWNEFRLPYAQLTGRGMLEKLVEEIAPNPSDAIVLYCSNGNRSLLSAYELKQMGYSNVKSLEGGINLYKRLGFGVVYNDDVVRH